MVEKLAKTNEVAVAAPEKIAVEEAKKVTPEAVPKPPTQVLQKSFSTL